MPVARSRAQFRLFDLVMWVVLAALIFASVREIRLILGRNGGSTGTGMYIGIGFGLWYVVWRILRTKRTGPVCQKCGRRFFLRGHQTNPTICTRCRMASLPPAQSRREQVRAWLWLLLIVTMLVALVGLPGWSRTVERFGGFAWIVFPLLALVATFGLVAAVIFLLVVVSLVRNLRMRFEKPILALARKSARQEGTIERSGPVTIWWCGSTDPGPIVMEQFEVIRKRFEQLIDEPSETPLLRMLVFDTRSASSPITGTCFRTWAGLTACTQVVPRTPSRSRPRSLAFACTIKRDRSDRVSRCIFSRLTSDSFRPTGFRRASVVF